MSKLRVIVDTNVIVSVVKGSKHLQPIYRALLDKQFTFVVTSELLRELASVLSRPKFKLDPADIRELFRAIQPRMEYFKLRSHTLKVCRDPDDDFILQAALEAKPDFVVTGDKDLLCLNPFRGIPVVSPKRFIDFLEKT